MSLHDDETDPTGMRELLRGLPAPGPMPDDLVARIQSSLADLSAPDATATEDETLSAVSRGTSPVARGPEAARPSWWARTGPRLAVAAAVLLGGGAVASGQLGLLATSSDSASSTAGSSGDDSESASDSGGAAAPDLTGATAARQAQPGPVVITMSDRSYTSSQLGIDVAQPLSATPLAPMSAETPAVGPIGTEIGVRSCLVALGLPRETGARVDLALLDGQPAAVVVVAGEGGRAAYAVGRDCTIGNPSVLAGPVHLP